MDHSIDRSSMVGIWDEITRLWCQMC